MPSRPERARLALVSLMLIGACPGEQDPGDTGTTGESTSSTATTAATDSTSGTDATAATTTGAATTGTTADPTTGPVGEYPSLDQRPCPEDSILTAENFGAPFMLTHCTGCHHVSLKQGERAGAPLGVDFETLAKVRALAPLIWARAGDQNATMPPLGPPPQDERTKLGEWLACGAPADADL